jgi:hypothetical protein
VEREEKSITRLQQPKQQAIAMQRLCKYVSAATYADATVEELLEKKHATIEKLLEVVFSMRTSRR